MRPKATVSAKTQDTADAYTLRCSGQFIGASGSSEGIEWEMAEAGAWWCESIVVRWWSDEREWNDQANGKQWYAMKEERKFNVW